MKTYDLAISLGGACSCSKALRNANLQFASFPFDWLNGSTLTGRIEMLECDFAGWLELDNLEPIKEVGDCNESHWRDRQLGFGYLHDFTKGAALAEDLPRVKEKYRRRTRHLYDLIDRSKRVLVVWVDVPTSPAVSIAEIRDCRRRLMSKWPGVEFDLLVFKFAEGVPIEAVSEEHYEGVRIVRFDYFDKKLDAGVKLGDDLLMGNWLAMHYKVADYRTEAEKVQWRRNAAKRKYRRLKADNLWDYLMVSIQYRIYKHLRKRLERKGVL